MALLIWLLIPVLCTVDCMFNFYEQTLQTEKTLLHTLLVKWEMELVVEMLCLFYLGSIVGNGICTHPDVRKLGFTGSTETGKSIMER